MAVGENWFVDHSISAAQLVIGLGNKTATPHFGRVCTAY
jgi:hypothetical protein